MATRLSELTIVTKAKDLRAYALSATDSADAPASTRLTVFYAFLFRPMNDFTRRRDFDNLSVARRAARRGKRRKKDVIAFEMDPVNQLRAPERA